MKRAVVVASFTLPLLAGACGDKVVTGSAPPPNRAAPAAQADAGLPAVLAAPEYSENDFVESDRNRDPFRSFLAIGGPQGGARPLVNQRAVKLAEYSIDELKLMAIVLGGDQSRAMFVDPTGKGTVVYRGNFICRPEVVHLGGSNGPEYQLNWRVDRIREGDIVLIREDPAQPSIPPATRVIPLHPENEDKDKEARSG